MYFTVFSFLCAFYFSFVLLFSFNVVVILSVSFPYSSCTNQSSGLREWGAMSPLGVSDLDTHTPFCGRVIQGQSAPEWPVCELDEHGSGQLWVCTSPACETLPFNGLKAQEWSGDCLCMALAHYWAVTRGSVPCKISKPSSFLCGRFLEVCSWFAT